MEEELRTNATMISGEMQSVMEATYFLMPNWKWSALVLMFIIGWLLRPLIEWILGKLKRSTIHFQDGNNFLHFLFAQATEINISWIILCIIWLIGIDALQLPVRMDKYLTLIVQIVLAFQAIRFLYRAADAFGSVLKTLAAKTSSPMDDQLAPFATKVAKFMVVIIGVLVALQNMGVEVVSLIAGLGIGGLALALAAQDTVANLFGSVMILLDSPFKVGDFIKVGDTEGIVEDVGFRSTRIRTFYNSVVTLPNSTVAKEKIDNMERRPQRRVRQILGLTYETPTEKIQEFCKGVREIILKNEKISKEGIAVTFNNFNAASLDVLMQFHIRTSDPDEELLITQKVFTEVLDFAKKIGVDFAYPTQTIYLKQDAVQNQANLSG